MSDFQRRVLVIDDTVAIHVDFHKILDTPNREENEQLAMLAANFLGELKPAANRDRPHYEISTASQGREGLGLVEKALREGRPIHVAFVDIRMPPGWDGIETIERLWEVDPNLQTVICSAYSDFSWDAIHARLGDSDRLIILKKPFDTAEIAQLAASLSEKYLLAQAARLRRDELETLVGVRTLELQRINEQLQEEIQRRCAIEEQLRHDVLHDRLTGLPNRAMLIDHINHCIQERKRDRNCQFALLFIDLDNFKVVNDSLGHETGDRLLIGIAERLSKAVRAVDTPSRLGGDEFVLLLDGLTSESDAIRVAERIETLVTEPFVIDGRAVVASMSIGVAIGHSHHEKAADILRDADTALYRAKHEGKHRIAFFDAEMHSDAPAARA